MDAISKATIEGFEAATAATAATTNTKEAQNVLAAKSMLEVDMQRTADDQAAYQPTREELLQATVELNNMAKILQTSLRFGYSDDINALYLQVLDSTDGSLIRQIPTEDVIRLITGMRELTGMLFDDRV